jgi:hypothetical protein
MEPKIILLLLSDLLLLMTTLVYGVKMLRRGNVLLGLEWLVVTVSTTNLLIYLLTEIQLAYDVSLFLDAFSRAFGIPLIATAGMMAVTHGYKPSMRTDIVWFVGAFAATFALTTLDAFAKALPYFYLVTWTGFSVFLAYFAWRLWRIGEKGHAVALWLALIAAQAIATIYDFYQIPGDQDHVIFLILALTTWAFLTAVSYHAYVALERSTENRA